MALTFSEALRCEEDGREHARHLIACTSLPSIPAPYNAGTELERHLFARGALEILDLAQFA